MEAFLRKAVPFLGLPKKSGKKNNAGTGTEGNKKETVEPPVQNGERTVKGEKEKVEETKEEQKGRTDMKVKDKGKLFIGGLSQKTTSEGLKAYFSYFGTVADCVVLRSPGSRRPRGFGFVTFADPADAEAALRANICFMDGRTVEVRPFDPEPRSKRQEGCRIFLGGVPYSMTEEELRTFFTRYGEMTEVVIPRGKPSNKAKGYAFISFSDRDAAEKCLADGFVYLQGKRVQITKAVPRDGSKASALQTEEECVDGDSVSDGVLLDDCSSLLDSGEPLSEVQDTPGFRQVIEEIVRQEITSRNTRNETKEDDRKEQQFKGWEKLFANFHSGDDTSLGSNKDVNEDDDDDDDDDEDDVYEAMECESPLSGRDPCQNSSESGDFLDDLCGKLVGMLADQPQPGTAVASTHDHPEIAALQKKTEPFKIRRKDGLLGCPLCKWSSPDGSGESLLNHCKTVAHRAKIKERHPSENCQKSKPEVTIKPNDQAKAIGSKLMMNPTAKERGDSGKRPSQEQGGKKEKKNVKEGRPKGAKEAESAGGSSTLKTKEPEVEKTPNPEAQALLKGIVAIEPGTQSLICKLCTVRIPFSQDFGALTKNAAYHLRSKKHLSKLAEVESSKGAPSSNGTTPGGKKNEVAQKPKAAGEKDKQEAKNQKTVVASNCKSTKEVKKTTKDCKGLGAPPQNKKFLCLDCNFSVHSQDLFNAHINSKSHLELHKKAGLTVSDTSFDQCRICKSYFVGSLISINKHYMNCLKV